MTGLDPERQFPGAAKTAQEAWFDANVRHQIGLLRTVGNIRNQLLRLLDKTETDLRHSINDRLRKQKPGATTPASVARKERLLAEVELIRNTAWKDAKRLWREEITAIAKAEPLFMDGILKTVVPVQVETTLPSARVVRSIITSRPFEGRVLSEWAESIRRVDIRRIHDQINIGLVQGEGAPAIARRVVGTVSLRGRNGVTQITRRQAAAITRTAANHVSNQARQEYFKSNADLVDQELFIATLDGVTTAICRSLDGERFPLGEGPIPPLHYQCRSLRTAILDAEALGNRPMKPVTERGLLREFAAERGLDRAPRRRADLPRGTKGLFDQFARTRTRELVGTVPAKTTYAEFLRRQPTDFQDDVLGVTKGKLFRKGGLELGQFVERSGYEIPLADLARMHEKAFRDAGLDPEDFLRRRR